MAISTGAALLGGALIGGATSMIGAGQAAGAAESAAATSAQAQMAQLEYLKEREAIPQQFREEALTQLGGLYGLEGGAGTQQALIERAQASPLYGAIMGGREAGEEAILRQAGATGGLRSGNVQANLYDYNAQLQNQALLQSYSQQLQGLTGMANLPSNAPQIGQVMGNIGQTQAAGQVASGQAWQQGLQGIGDIAGSAAGQYLQYSGMGLI